MLVLTYVCTGICLCIQTGVEVFNRAYYAVVASYFILLYCAQVANKCSLPAEALAMIRYHSAYPWHTGGAYREFMTARDEEMMKWVLTFNKYDLYTKSEIEDDFASIRDNLDDLWRYYEQIIAKYFPEPNLVW